MNTVACLIATSEGVMKASNIAMQVLSFITDDLAHGRTLEPSLRNWTRVRDPFAHLPTRNTHARFVSCN
jgi:hypothetical protein